MCAEYSPVIRSFLNLLVSSSLSCAVSVAGETTLSTTHDRPFRAEGERERDKEGYTQLTQHTQNTHTYTHTNKQTDTHKQTLIYKHKHTYAHTCTHANTHTTHTHINKYTHTPTQKQTNTHVHTHTHTHTHTLQRQPLAASLIIQTTTLYIPGKMLQYIPSHLARQLVKKGGQNAKIKAPSNHIKGSGMWKGGGEPSYSAMTITLHTS